MKTVILLRHADYDIPVDGPAPDTTPLNAAGQARAEALIHVVGNAGVTAVFASQARRTQQTVEPLTLKLGLEFRVRPTLPELVQEVLSEQTVAVVLIAGHSNTVPQLITALGAPFPEAIIAGFDNLFVVTVVGPGVASVVRLKYGSQTP